MRCGAIILCGGCSRRMGQDKASLPLGNELMLPRVARLVAQVVEAPQIVCVAAAGQDLPPLPQGVRIVRDRWPNRGPLEGLAVGINAIRDAADAVYATGCDSPLMLAPFIRQMFNLLDDHEISVPFDGKIHYPLAAVYRTSVLPAVERILATGNRGPKHLLALCRTREVPTEQLRRVDPKLLSLMNCNCPADYERARETIQRSLRAGHSPASPGSKSTVC